MVKKEQPIFLYSEIIRLFIASGTNNLSKIVTLEVDGLTCAVTQLYRENLQESIVPELCLEVSENIEESITLIDFISKLAFFYFELGDHSFEFIIQILPKEIKLKPLK